MIQEVKKRVIQMKYLYLSLLRSALIHRNSDFNGTEISHTGAQPPRRCQGH